MLLTPFLPPLEVEMGNHPSAFLIVKYLSLSPGTSAAPFTQGEFTLTHSSLWSGYFGNVFGVI